MTLGQKFQEFFYSLTTNDKYSDYDSSKSFNRVNKPDSENNLLYSHHNQSVQALIVDDNDLDGNFYNKSTLEGVHEVKLAWRHIKNWLDKNSPDLAKTLQDKCTNSDLNDFQKDLKIKLPQSVIEFFKLTDGQSTIGNNDNDISGLIFGLKLMTLDEIVGVTENWRKVAEILHNELSQLKQSNKLNELSKLKLTHANDNQISKKLSGSETETSSTKTSIDIVDSLSATSSTTITSSGNNKSSIVSQQQRCIPPGSIHETFAHPMWIPLITDEVGNYIGIDLSPPPNGSGNWGQVILFGREFDFKFKIADNWGDFLLIFANDLESGNWDLKYNKRNNDSDLFVGEEGDLVFIDKFSKREIPYFDVLKARTVKKWTCSLQNSDDIPLSKEVSNLINELNLTNGSILNLSSNYNSIDSFINDNLTVIDEIDENLNKNKSTPTPPSKSPIKSNILKSKSINSTKPSRRSPLVNQLELEDDDEDEDDNIENDEDIVDDDHFVNENTIPTLANIQKFADRDV
ncbi:Smi1b protein [Scheffersomyces amazonensis]|uniref:Smi1b protein n=1 Tax=Scheffersomyces amazonensis TaxID=1078765 RepID=UPI00315CFA2F